MGMLVREVCCDEEGMWCMKRDISGDRDGRGL